MSSFGATRLEQRLLDNAAEFERQLREDGHPPADSWDDEMKQQWHFHHLPVSNRFDAPHLGCFHDRGGALQLQNGETCPTAQAHSTDRGISCFELACWEATK